MKIVLMGDAQTGKTTFLETQLGRAPPQRYVPTLGVNVENTVLAGKPVAIWDTAGQPHLAGIADGYFIGADLAIVFGDNTQPWIQRFRSECDAPIFNARQVNSLENLINSLAYLA